MSEPCAIVILYDGNYVDKNKVDVVNHVVNILVQEGIITGNNPKVICKDASSLANLILQDCKNENAAIVKLNESKASLENEALRSSIIIIGKMFAETLIEGEKTLNYSKFAMELLTRMHDPHIRKAVEIISTTTGRVPRRLIAEYHMKPGAIEVIRDVNGMITHLVSSMEDMDLRMCHGEQKQRFVAKPGNSRHKNAIPYKRKKKYRDDYQQEDD